MRMPLLLSPLLILNLLAAPNLGYSAGKQTPAAESDDFTAPETPKNMSLDDQIEAIDSSPRKPAPQPAPPQTIAPAANTESAPAIPPLDSKGSPKQEDDFLGLNFREPIGDKHSWYRGSGEWIASRTVRDGLVGDEPVSKILTDGKRFDASIGKRIPLIAINEESLTRAWSIGFDGGMLATLFRNSGSSAKTVFATENFDGFFGGYVARALDNTILMYRIGHISSHLVDNNPRVIQAIPYSRFWNEIIVSQTLSSITQASPWDLHVQASVGLNFMSEPNKDNPRWLAGIDLGRTLGNPDSMAVVATFDIRHPGVANQLDNYAMFVGIGRLRRPETTHRPFKAGVSHHWGSDYRNQYYNRSTRFTSFEVQIEF